MLEPHAGAVEWQLSEADQSWVKLSERLDEEMQTSRLEGVPGM